MYSILLLQQDIKSYKYVAFFLVFLMSTRHNTDDATDSAIDAPASDIATIFNAFILILLYLKYVSK